MTMEVYARVFDADRRIHQFRAVYLFRDAFLEPGIGRRANALGLARDERTLPGRQRKDSRMPQASEPGNPPLQLVGAARFRKPLLNELPCFLWRLGRVGRTLLHLCPEADRVAQLA